VVGAISSEGLLVRGNIGLVF